MNKHSLATLLTVHSIRRTSGTKFFERGKEYFEHGQVAELTESEGVIYASVHGTRPYEVKLLVDDYKLAYACSCPVGVDGEFCKHCVAVGLAWLEREQTASTSSSRSKKKSVTMDDVWDYLARQEHATLVNLLIERAKEDERLRDRLMMKAAKTGKKGLNVTTFRRAIDRAVNSGEFVDYYEAYAYAQGIEDVIDSIEELLREGYATEVIELLEHALRGVEHSLGGIDDSDGHMGGVLDRLQELHHQACQVSHPDPEALATRLFEWELKTDWDTFYGAVDTYADVLGEQGLSRYRTLAEERWAWLPPLKSDDTRQYRDHGRFRLTRIMEALAKQSGDIEALVAIKAKDLSYAYHYVEIAEIYQKAKQPDLALEWAERGVRVFAKKTDSRLREFLAKEYHRRDRHEDAMQLIWVEFSDFPQLDRYQLLKNHAEKIQQWPSWREKALAFIRATLSKEKKRGQSQRWHWGIGADHSELVRIFLWEKDVEAAWKEAKEGGCSSDLWLKLAAKREADHPEEAMEVYQHQIEPTLMLKNNKAYKEAVRYLKHIRRLMETLGRGLEFKSYVQTVRLAHKPKRNFMKLLDQQGWG